MAGNLSYLLAIRASEKRSLRQCSNDSNYDAAVVVPWIGVRHVIVRNHHGVADPADNTAVGLGGDPENDCRSMGFNKTHVPNSSGMVESSLTRDRGHKREAPGQEIP